MIEFLIQRKKKEDDKWSFVDWIKTNNENIIRDRLAILEGYHPSREYRAICIIETKQEVPF